MLLRKNVYLFFALLFYFIFFFLFVVMAVAGQVCT